ncbi:matrix metalloproteinase-14-like [Pseudomyrmex gracilis]|uniref:matrix metalloproteinase-14-like n=1 Tax=Pseudomyrmex gracilis TaxID=219809 RepID=UPI0009954AB8|nr:matrix metalloproteinase-14-like [Pseudomyrmex gracilis]
MASLALPLAFLALLVAFATSTSIVLTRSMTNTTKRSVVDGREAVIAFLRKYGYLEDIVDNSLVSEGALNHAVSLFQEFYNLPINGELNAETMRTMNRSRCGVRDIQTRYSNKEYIHKWPTTHLTWNFLFASRANLQIAETAFALWAANSSLTFTCSVHNPNIVILYKGRHTMWDKHYSDTMCPFDFDGRDGVLVQAYYPNGDLTHVSEIHIANEEQWHVQLTKNPWNKDYLLHTLTHEIKHAIGIEHSLHDNSVMYAFVPVKQWLVALSLDDVLAVHNHYGPNSNAPELPPVSTFVPPTVAPTTTTTTTPQPPLPRKPKPLPPRHVCEVRNPDVILSMKTITIIAYDKYVYIASSNWGPYIYPHLLKEYLRFLPSNFTKLDAACQQSSGELVLFADGYVYLVSYPSLRLQDGWPRSFSEIGLPSDATINTAFQSSMGHTYVIFNNDSVAVVNDCNVRIKEYNKLKLTFPGVPPSMSLAYKLPTHAG